MIDKKNLVKHAIFYLVVLINVNCYNIRGHIYKDTTNTVRDFTVSLAIYPSYYTPKHGISLSDDPYRLCVAIESENKILLNVKVSKFSVIDLMSNDTIVSYTEPAFTIIPAHGKPQYEISFCAGRSVDLMYSLHLPENDIGVQLEIVFGTDKMQLNLVAKHKFVNYWKSSIWTHFFEN